MRLYVVCSTLTHVLFSTIRTTLPPYKPAILHHIAGIHQVILLPIPIPIVHKTHSCLFYPHKLPPIDLLLVLPFDLIAFLHYLLVHPYQLIRGIPYPRQDLLDLLLRIH